MTLTGCARDSRHGRISWVSSTNSADDEHQPPMISRHWRGLAKADQAQNYTEHLRSDTFPALRNLPGFMSASILTRPIADGIEFLIITQWRALDDIARFSSQDL